MKTIRLFPYTSDFAENKDVARDIRIHQIIPEIEAGRSIILDFEGITAATQSFIHALISELIRKYTDEVYEKITFKNCSPSVRQIINIVADYMEDGS